MHIPIYDKFIQSFNSVEKQKKILKITEQKKKKCDKTKL